MPAVESQRLIAVGGLSGSGKTTLSRTLSTIVPNVVLLRSDVERKRLFGIDEATRLGPDGYTAEVTAKVYRALAEKAAVAMRDGANAIVDAVFARKNERDEIAAIAGAGRAVFVGLWLEAPLAVQLQRVEARRGDASDATADVVVRQQSYELGALSWHRIDAGGSADEALAAALAIIDPSRSLDAKRDQRR